MLDILKGTIELGEKLAKLFKSVKIKITGNEKTAAADLNIVIDELRKFYDAIQSEISDFQSLDFSDSANISKNKRTLFDMQSGTMNVRISDASGSCSKIKRIYDSHLDTWFKKTFQNEDQKYLEIQHIFKQLSEYDLSMIEATNDLVRYLSPKCDEILKMMTENDKDKIIAYHDSISNELLETRKKISEVAKQLIDFKNEFLKASGTI
jgi:uncharacterized coiled-coil DUF342 family protein